MSAEDPDVVEDYFKLGYRGARFASGYRACPEQEDRAKMMELPGPERIVVTLSEELQLHPEQSTDAFDLHHRQNQVHQRLGWPVPGVRQHRLLRNGGEFTRALVSESFCLSGSRFRDGSGQPEGL